MHVKGMSIKLSVPMVFEENYIEELIEMNERRTASAYIKEVYGALKEDIIGNLRPSFSLKEVSEECLKKSIRKVHDAGIEFNYVINSTVSDGREYSKEGRKEILTFIGKLIAFGVDSFTITSSYYIRLIRHHFPYININASICNEIESVQKALEFENAGATCLVLNRDINRNFKVIKKIRENTKSDLKVLCTTPCLYRCVDVHYHSNLSSTMSNSLKHHILVDEANAVSHTSVNCLYKKVSQLEENIKSPWIRPEDMKYYEAIGVNSFKIDGRDRKGEYNIEVIKAYLDQKFEGNLLYLMKEGYPRTVIEIENKSCVSYLRMGIDNRELDGFIDSFIEDKVSCDMGCKQCGYCHRYAKKIKVDETWRNGFGTFLTQELEKRYS